MDKYIDKYANKITIVVIVLFFTYLTITIPVYQRLDLNYEFEGTNWELLDKEYDLLRNSLEDQGYQLLEIRKGRAYRAKNISFHIPISDWNEGDNIAKTINSLGYKGTYSPSISFNNTLSMPPYQIEIIKEKKEQRLLIYLIFKYSNREITEGIFKNILGE